MAALEKFHMTIDNEDCESESGETLRCLAPYEQQDWAEIPAGTAADVDRAVRSAHKAFTEGWWRHDARRRAQAMDRFADALEAAGPALARLEMRDCGKPIREALGVTGQIANFFRYGAGLCMSATVGEIQQGPSPALMCHTVRQPYGVIAVQVPWNNPLGVMVQEAALALAAGNAIVVKPSEFAPCSILALGEVARQADIPPGIINIVSGLGPVTGAALCDHPLVRKIIFTGGGAAAQLIAEAAAKRFVPMVLELGGKSPSVIFEDANLDNAVRSISGGFTGSTGQSCTAASRVLVQASIYGEFVERLVAAVKAFPLGDPSDPRTAIGPLTSRQQVERVSRMVQMGLDEGATAACGGGRPTSPELADHPYFFEPTVFTNVDPSMRIFREEVFGPVTCVVPFADEKEALALANDTDYGLGASVWTKDIHRAQRMTRELYAGTVWVNTYRVGDPSFPFGGVKESGYGRECGLAGFHEMSYLKSVRIAYEL
ncbi:aldehyde dehydrogenase family protein [Pseudofrankia inefficax]|uniref:Aldehyde Dehydrogenase n=1 Tax=Pseudofrankia inefficax (strain DSM 45817 / CECT 9037 / DDB 130130 / EuI1c) TaxID=298654 RepID=E3J7W7_PSEI1|nr:aldehyde dehydrogenase family protein [Pseudofrankia inefficax]ADP80871.1 Aldehyde Dehydrogenase [Pseudofrankia inefficax]